MAKASDFKEVIVIPPFLFIEEVGKVLKKAKLGAQDIVPLETARPIGPSGAQARARSLTGWTGEISLEQLKNLRVKYVIVGHSERRHKLGETEEVVAKKLKAALAGSLTPILCVGETKPEKDAGKREKVIEKQIRTALPEKFKSGDLLIAYEPVWAVGAGDPETPENARESLKYIKQLILRDYRQKVRTLYGGSLSSKNLGEYLKYKEIDGALVGAASLKKKEIEEMVKLI